MRGRVKGHHAPSQKSFTKCIQGYRAGPPDVTFVHLADSIIKGLLTMPQRLNSREIKMASFTHDEMEGAHARAIDDASATSRTLALLGEHIRGMLST